MSVADKLEALRQSVHGCLLVAYADIDAQIVLVSSSETRASREMLDALCVEAASIFAAADAGEPTGGLAGADTGVSVTSDDLRIFLRMTGTGELSDGSEALCCVGDPGVDVDAFLTAARAALPDVFEATGGGQ